jgi:hypothetical protein
MRILSLGAGRTPSEVELIVTPDAAERLAGLLRDAFGSDLDADVASQSGFAQYSHPFVVGSLRIELLVSEASELFFKLHELRSGQATHHHVPAAVYRSELYVAVDEHGESAVSRVFDPVPE